MIREVSKEGLSEVIDRIAFIHLSSFNDRRSMKQMRESIMQYSEVPGFRCFVAETNGAVHGYLYGYQTERSQFYRQLIDHCIDEKQSEQLDGAFEILSLAVDKESRQSGIGTQLINALPKGKYYLTSDVHNVAANAYYYKTDWTLMKANLHLHPNIPDKHLYFKEIK